MPAQNKPTMTSSRCMSQRGHRSLAKSDFMEWQSAVGVDLFRVTSAAGALVGIPTMPRRDGGGRPKATATVKTGWPGERPYRLGCLVIRR